MIAGGTAAVVSFAMFVYLITGNTFSIKPGDRLTMTQFVSNASEGVYNISFPLFEGQPNVRIVGPANQTIVEKTIEPPIANEVFTAAESGDYTLILTNPSPDANLEATILFGDRESYATLEQLIFSFALYAGITAAIAGAVITILDRRRISRMKQFGDTSDLV